VCVSVCVSVRMCRQREIERKWYGSEGVKRQGKKSNKSGTTARQAGMKAIKQVSKRQEEWRPTL
jgi:hypothetical protein